MAAKESKGKGIGFKGLLKSLEELKGADARQRCVAACPKELREAIEYGHLVSGGWYPLSWIADLHAAIAKTLGTGPDFARELSRHATSHDLKTIYNMASVFFSTETLMKQSVRMMRLYFDGATSELLEMDKGRARVRFTGFGGYDHRCWQDLIGGTWAGLECAKAKDIQVVIHDGGKDGDDFMDASFTWKDG